MWSINTLKCKRCGQLLGILPDVEGAKEARIKDLNGKCPRCGKILQPNNPPEYHHELYFSIKEFIWKITHPWRLFK